MSRASFARLKSYVRHWYDFEDDRTSKNWHHRLEFMTNIQDVHGGVFILSDLPMTRGNALVWRQAARVSLNGMAEIFFMSDGRCAVKLTEFGTLWVKSKRVSFNQAYARRLKKQSGDSGGKSMAGRSKGQAS